MKASDTVMSAEQISVSLSQSNLTDEVFQEHEVVAKAQAEISFKAGIKEVVEWIEKEYGYFIDDRLCKIIIDDIGYFSEVGSIKKWQSKLKSWGI